jgi:hypothetical protein
VHSEDTFFLLLVFPEASQVGWGMLQRLCDPKEIKGENGEKVCFFDVVSFTFFLGGCLMCLSSMSYDMV